MQIETTAVSYGRPAYEALVGSVRAFKSGDSLRPVRIVVPTDRIGVSARRALARGTKDKPGIAALEIVTLRRLAEQRAGGQLAAQGRRPLTGPVLSSIVRSVLKDSPGRFGPVAEHPATVRALADAHRTLRPLSQQELALITPGFPMVEDVVRLHRLIREAWQGQFFDEQDLLDAALTTEKADTTATVVFLPQDSARSDVALVQKLAETAPVTVLLGTTGDRRADAGVLTPWDLPHQQQAPSLAARVLSSTDPDDEVRHVVRAVVQALTTKPGHRIAVVYGSSNPYARLLHEHLARAGVPLNGRGVRPTYELQAGRAARRLFALLDDDVRRDAVMTLITDSPARWDGKRTPSTQWERLSRAAGVVAGDDWDHVTNLHQRKLADAAAEREAPEPREWLAEKWEREAAGAGALHGFVTDLRNQLTGLTTAQTWHELSERSVALLDSLFPETEHWSLPEEKKAAERVRSLLVGLHALDSVSEEPSLEALRDLLDVELSDDLGRVGRAGEGIHVAAIHEAIGLDVDQVFVVGLAEGLLPSRIAEDPLLPDEIRSRVPELLPSSRTRIDRQARYVLAAFAGARDGATASYSRGDLRQGGERVPSRWLLPSVRTLTDNPNLQATDLIVANGSTVLEIPSYASGLERADVPASEQEWFQRSLALTRRTDGDLAAELSALPAAELSVELQRARRSSAFTRFDGNLQGSELPDPTTGRPISPTALEAWTGCPHGYFVRYLLGVSELEEPEEVLRISAAEKGTLIHKALENWLQEQIDAGTVPAPHEPWPDAAWQQLRVHLDAACDAAEHQGVTGRRLLWQEDKAAIIADMRAFVEADNQRRAEHGLTPIATELPFGMGGHEPIAVDLGNGRALKMKGKADRIDRDENGGLVAVDYKTGRSDDYKVLTEENPTDHGSRFQLPVYALAAQQAHSGTSVRGEYWFISRRAAFLPIGYNVTQDVLNELATTADVVVSSISAGIFPARPFESGKAWQCPTCALVGDVAVQRSWTSKMHDPSLHGYLVMLGEADDV